MGALKSSDLSKREIPVIIHDKINGKNGYANTFELKDGKTVKLKFNEKIPGIVKLFKTNQFEDIQTLSKVSTTKFFFIDSKNKTIEYKITDLEKTEEFGSTGGSGGGADATAVFESMQCYYNALRYILGKEINADNAPEKEIKRKDVQDRCYTFAKKGSGRNKAKDLIAAHYVSGDSGKKLRSWIEINPADNQNVYMRIANKLADNEKWSKAGLTFHRGSPLVDAIYESRKLALDFDKQQEVQKAPASGFDDNKWNPADIWMTNLDPNPSTSKPLDFGKGGKSCNLTFEKLKEEVFELAQSQKLLGISLKKVDLQPKYTPFNTYPDRTNNAKVNLASYTFGQTGDFFSSIDLYLNFSGTKNESMQFRATATTKSWQGEVKGSLAAKGKIGGGGMNFYTNDILGNPIGTMQADALKWKETTFSDSKHFKDFHELYMKYNQSSKNQFKKSKSQTVTNFNEFKKLANGYSFRGKNASASFKFSKYMGLLLLESIYGPTGSANPPKLKEWSTQVLRYAMSNIDISSYFVKISQD